MAWRARTMSILEFPKGPALSWQGRLDLADNEAEVVEVARDYLASLDPFEIDAMPEHCKPRKLFVAADIASYGFDLARCHCAQPDAAGVVHRTAAFFLHANSRLAAILANMNDGEAEQQESA